MNVDSPEIGSGSLFQGVYQIATDRIAEANVSCDASTEEGRCALSSAIKELIG
jgi:hypothetical protein